MQGHKELIVWQKAMELVVAVYKLSQSFPKTETYGLATKGRGLNSVEHCPGSRPQANSGLREAFRDCQRLTRGTRNPVGDRRSPGLSPPEEPTGYRADFRNGDVVGFTAEFAVTSCRA